MKPSAPYYIISVALFCFFIFIGYAIGGIGDVAREFARGIQTFFASINGDGSPLRVFLGILINNEVKALGLIVFGGLFWIFPTFFTAVNGLTMGLLVRVVVILGVPFSVFFAAILPHGILELTGFFIATAYGFWLGTRFYEKLGRGAPFKPHIKFALLVYIKIIFPMIAVAAAIETFVTPLVIDWIKD